MMRPKDLPDRGTRSRWSRYIGIHKQWGSVYERVEGGSGWADEQVDVCSDCKKGRLSARSFISNLSTHVGPVGGSLCVDGNSSEKGASGSVKDFRRHGW